MVANLNLYVTNTLFINLFYFHTSSSAKAPESPKIVFGGEKRSKDRTVRQSSGGQNL